MSFKVCDKHWEVICNFMENHTDLAAGRLNKASLRDTHRRLWEQLTIELNNLGYGKRKLEKWQKTWTDFKYNLKRKVKARECLEKSDEPGQYIQFTPYEKRILPLLEKTFHKGVASRPVISLEDSKELDDKNWIEDPLSPSLSSTSSTPLYKSPQTQTIRGKKRITKKVTNHDHSYLKSAGPSRKRVRPMEEIYEDALIVLNEVNSNLPMIADAINRLTDVLHASLNKITEKEIHFL